MAAPSVVIIGGGLAGLSAGCYARASGLRTQIIEHRNLGGVCTAWRRGPFLVDGCIQWLTGGPFARVYRELGVLQQVGLRPIDHFIRIQDGSGTSVDVTADLAALEQELARNYPEDAQEIRRLIDGARHVAELEPPLDTAPDLLTLRDGARTLWSMRHEIPTLLHFRQPLAQYAEAHIVQPRLRRLLSQIVPPEAPALFLLMVLGYLARGWLSRPVGGSEAFRDALVRTYESLGGEVRLGVTVEEILVEGGRARGVRLADGSWIEADAVVSTSSMPETVFQLLGGRYDAEATERRLREWKLFTPIVLASFGVALPLGQLPQLLAAGDLPEFEVGGKRHHQLRLRICTDQDGFAPAGNAVVQAMVETDFAWWARRGDQHALEKQRAGEIILDAVDRVVPGARLACRMIDIATPLTFWASARSWRGAYEGWMPSGAAMLAGALPHRMPGLDGMYVAGQWVEPGGGVPLACASGRSAVQTLCVDRGVPFATPR